MSPRILHLADIHAGLLTHGHVDAATGLNSRLLDVARCWRRACEIAVERDVDAVIVAGDIFHSPNPDAASLVLFGEGLRFLRFAKIPAVLIPGNHDRARHQGQRSVVELWHDPPHVYAITQPDVVSVADIQVACLPWVSRANLMARYPGASRAEGVQLLNDALQFIVADLYRHSPDVITGHWTVEGCTFGSDVDVSLIGEVEPMLPLAALEPFRYAAFGHLHRHQAIPPAGWASGAYSGSLDRVTFAEEDEEKVVLEVDLDHEPRTVTVHPLPARAFVTLNLQAALDGDLGDIEGAIVRIRGELAAGDSGIDRSKLVRICEERGAETVKLEISAAPTAPRRQIAQAETAGPLDLIAECVQEEPAERREELLALAREVMA